MTDSVRDAVFGNVGTTISFRVSADDAPMLVKQFEPTFDESDIIQLNNRHFVISMIINGEKVPAFSATTLSIPSTPKDNLNAIIEHSREEFARPRADVESEIRETIEQSEKYKKDLADSGRQDEAGANGGEKPIFRPLSSTEHKPNLKYERTPQGDFMRQKLSPNTAEGKERLGLKDLAKVLNEQRSEEEPRKKEKAKKGKKSSKKRKNSTPVVPSVKPEIEYQEKSGVAIEPTHDPLPLSTPVKRTDDFADKDNSVDGFLAVKH